jgi:DNA topoisomerase-1
MVNVGRYGPYILFREKFYSLGKNIDLMLVTVDECLEIIAQKEQADQARKPVTIGQHEGKEVQVAVGRYGPYVAYEKQFFSLPKGTDITAVTLEEAVNVMVKNNEKKIAKTFSEDADVRILNGRFGYYITQGKKNYKIPKGVNASELTYQQCMDIIGKSSTASKGSKSKSKKKTSR